MQGAPFATLVSLGQESPKGYGARTECVLQILESVRREQSQSESSIAMHEELAGSPYAEEETQRSADQAERQVMGRSFEDVAQDRGVEFRGRSEYDPEALKRDFEQRMRRKRIEGG